MTGGCSPRATACPRASATPPRFPRRNPGPRSRSARRRGVGRRLAADGRRPEPERGPRSEPLREAGVREDQLANRALGIDALEELGGRVEGSPEGSRGSLARTMRFRAQSEVSLPAATSRLPSGSSMYPTATLTARPLERPRVSIRTTLLQPASCSPSSSMVAPAQAPAISGRGPARTCPRSGPRGVDQLDALHVLNRLGP